MSELEFKTNIVNTLYGPVKGKSVYTVFGEGYNAFNRIPYMKPPVGELRFKDPQSVENWTEVLDGTVDPTPTFHLNDITYELEGNEDALFLNVFTKNLKPKKLVPVMVWIYGGAFSSGSSSLEIYSPDFLLQRNVVVVTINYRVGVLGFMSFNDPELQVPGNAGLKDQTMALKWINKNIEVFGGDPNNITIFGESAGGVSVHYHMLSDLSKNIFHKAIAFSGCALNSWANLPHNFGFGYRLAKALGWNESDGNKKALEILQNIPPEQLIGLQTTIMTPEEIVLFGEMPFLPVVEPFDNDQCFIPKRPTEMIKSAWSDSVPLILCGIPKESRFLIHYLKLNERPEIIENLGDFESIVPIDIRLSSTPDNVKQFGLGLKEYYYGNEQPTLQNVESYVDLMSDQTFLHGIHEVVKDRAKNTKSAPTYFLRFNYDSPEFNHFKTIICKLKMKGASHADDLSYIFKNSFYDLNGGLKPGTRDYRTVQRMVGILTSFAETGNPNWAEIEPTVWEPVNNTTIPFKCLNIDDNVEFIDYPETERLLVWDNLYSKFSKN